MDLDKALFAKDAAAAPVLAALLAKKWRKARDAAKILCRTDRTRYLPLLIAANEGLYLDLMERGMESDARPVLEFLKSIAPQPLIDGLTRRASQERRPEAGPTVSGTEVRVPQEAWPALIEAGATLRAGREPNLEAWRIADRFATGLAEPPPPAAEESAESVALRADCVAARTAIDATAEGQWEAAREAMRSIGSQSMFRHWRTFLRGVRHAYQGELRAAEACFSALPAETATARAATVFRGAAAVAAGRASGLDNEVEAEVWLALSGEPLELAKPIAGAQADWLDGAWGRAFKQVARGFATVRRAFPTAQRDLSGALSDVFFMGRPALQCSEDRLVRSMGVALNQLPNLRGPDAVVVVTRHIALSGWDPETFEPEESLREFSLLLERWAELDGKNRMRDAAAWAGLGQRIVPVNRRLAEDVWKRALRLDPDDRNVALSLLELKRDDAQDEADMAFVREIAERFARDRPMQTAAALRATHWGDGSLAVACARRAAALDPLDLTARWLLLESLVWQARQCAERKEEANGIWAEIEPLLDERADNVLARPWVNGMRRALISKDRKARQMTTEGAPPSTLDGLVMERLLMAELGRKLPSRWRTDWANERLKTILTGADVARLIGLVSGSQFREGGPRFEKEVAQLVTEVVESIRLDRMDEAHALHVTRALIALRMLPLGWWVAVEMADWVREHMPRQIKNKPATGEGRLASLLLPRLIGDWPRKTWDASFQKFVEDARKSGRDDLALMAASDLRTIQMAEEAIWHHSKAHDIADPDEAEDMDQMSGPDEVQMMILRFAMMEAMQALKRGDQTALNNLRKRMLEMGIPEREVKSFFRGAQDLLDRFPDPEPAPPSPRKTPSRKPRGAKSPSSKSGQTEFLL